MAPMAVVGAQGAEYVESDEMLLRVYSGKELNLAKVVEARACDAASGTYTDDQGRHALHHACAHALITAEILAATPGDRFAKDISGDAPVDLLCRNPAATAAAHASCLAGRDDARSHVPNEYCAWRKHRGLYRKLELRVALRWSRRAAHEQGRHPWRGIGRAVTNRRRRTGHSERPPLSRRVAAPCPPLATTRRAERRWAPRPQVSRHRPPTRKAPAPRPRARPYSMAPHPT